MRHPLAVALTLVLLIATGAAIAGEPAGRTPRPAIEPATAGTQCLATPDVMRRDHPSMLKHQRDETVHRGVREATRQPEGLHRLPCQRRDGQRGTGADRLLQQLPQLRGGEDRLLRVPFEQGAAHHRAGRDGPAMKTGAEQGLAGRRKFLGPGCRRHGRRAAGAGHPPDRDRAGRHGAGRHRPRCAGAC
jgi:hypothetical protein